MRVSHLGHVVALASLALVASSPAPGQFEGEGWIPIGPAPGSFGDKYGAVSGRATVIAVNPFNVDDLWLGTSQGGVWHTTNGGKHWVPTSDGEASLAIGAIALDGCTAAGCTTIYVGTGEDAIRRDTFYGHGLLRGIVGQQGDVTWTAIDGDLNYDFRFASIYDLVLDPGTFGSNKEIYITLGSGVTASAAEATETAPEPVGGYGLYRSVTQGNGWEKLAIPGTTGSIPTDLKMHPTDSDVLYVGFMSKGIFKTTNGGDDWCPLNPLNTMPAGCEAATGLPFRGSFDWVEFAISESNPEILYATFGNCPDSLLDECRPPLYRTPDGGATWEEVHWTALNAGCMRLFTRYARALAIHPSFPERIWVGGRFICYSQDGGLTFDRADRQKGQTPAQKEDNGFILHPDHRQIEFFDDDVAFQVGDGGFSRSTDGGMTWKTFNNNLQTIGFQSLAVSPLTSTVIGGTQDNSGQAWWGTSDWRQIAGVSDGGFAIMDLDDPRTLYITSNAGGLDHFWCDPKRSTDEGASVQGLGSEYLGDDRPPAGDPQAFYSPFVQDPSPPHPLYFGTNRLWTSGDDGDTWSTVSPVLSSTPTDEIVAQQDVITAIAVAPSDPKRIYLGYYSGKVFRTDDPCDTIECWERIDNDLPNSIITSIAVDPGDPDKAYATLGGFFDGVHAYATDDADPDRWVPLAPHSSLKVPANTIIVEPSDPDRLWLGTDNGVVNSECRGCLWERAQGLPNVPVFQLAIDETRDRLYAATHGRGAFVLTRPAVGNLEGWVGGDIWDVPVYGHGFLPGQSCTIKLLRQDFSECASGSKDVFEGALSTDDEGRLVSTAGGFYEGRQVVWACNQGNCLDDAAGQTVPISDCNQEGNVLAAVLLRCGDQVAINILTGCPIVTAPPSAWNGLTGIDEFPESTAPDAGPIASYELIPVLFAGDGTTERLCGVDVPVLPGDTVRDVMARSAMLVSADGGCAAAGVAAEVVEGRAPEAPAPEDGFPKRDNIKLAGPGLIGGQLVPAICTAPGEATGLGFELSRLALQMTHQLQIPRIRFETGAGGAAGGEVSLTEISMLGACGFTITTQSGDTAFDIAQALEDAFAAPGIPGPDECPAAANPRDVQARGRFVFTVLADQIEVRTTDPNVGFCMAPEEICFTDQDCSDGNPCTDDTCDPTTGRCKHSPEPDLTPCFDLNPCTVGNSCFDGMCGAPLDCADSNPCTDDSCSPGVGCRNVPVVCDDGNPCTEGFCDASGDCAFLTLTGPCNDGNNCTIGDTCVFDPIEQQSECRGVIACDDGDPCTQNVCDRLTGACSFLPPDCDDGNPCTVDLCTNGQCQPSFTSGPCDDGDACTENDLCEADGQGGIACFGQPVACSDGDACTLDTCDPVFGTCDFPTVPIDEAGSLTFESVVRLTWPVTPGAASYNTYRGSIAPAAPFAYDHACFEIGDAGGDGPTASEDGGIPVVGDAFYYLVTVVTECGEGPVGADGFGGPRPAGASCP